MSFCCTLITSSIYKMRYNRISQHSNEFAIFSICLFKSISSPKISFNEFYFLSSSKYVLSFTWTRLCGTPYNITAIFPHFWFINWSWCPFCCSKCNHIRLLLFILICNHQWWSIIRPIIEKSCKFFSYRNYSPVETLVTTICSKCCIWWTTDWLILSEWNAIRWRSNCWSSSRCWRSIHWCRRSIHWCYLWWRN